MTTAVVVLVALIAGALSGIVAALLCSRDPSPTERSDIALASVGVLDLGPSGILVVHVAKQCTDKELHALKEHMGERLLAAGLGKDRVMVLGPDRTLSALRF